MYEKMVVHVARSFELRYTSDEERRVWQYVFCEILNFFSETF